MAGTRALELAPRLPAAASRNAAAILGLVLLVLLVADLAPALRFTALVAFLVAAARARHELARATAGRRLHWSADGTWRVDGRKTRLHPATRVLAGLVVLRFADRRSPACWVPRGSLPAEEFRRLKARLRLEGGRAVQRGREDRIQRGR